MNLPKQIRLPAYLTLSVLCVLCVLWNAGTLQAFNPQPDPPAFSLIGMNPDQTARFGISCPNVAIRGLSPGPCRGTLSFRDSCGAEVKQTRYSLKPGESAFAELTPGDIDWGDRNRFEFEPSIKPQSGRAVPAVQLVSNITGKTEMYVGPVSPRLGMIEDPNL
jgi:hypothetical protein